MKKQSKAIGLLTSSFLPNLGGVEIGIHNIAKNLILTVIVLLFLHHGFTKEFKKII